MNLRTHMLREAFILTILKTISAMPPTGMRSLPVQNNRNFFCSGTGMNNTTSQNALGKVYVG